MTALINHKSFKAFSLFFFLVNSFTYLIDIQYYYTFI